MDPVAVHTTADNQGNSFYRPSLALVLDGSVFDHRKHHFSLRLRDSDISRTEILIHSTTTTTTAGVV